MQYAHARISSILQLAQQKNLNFADGNVSLLTTEAELSLIRKMLLLPEVIELVVNNLEPHHLAYYAQELATSFHQFYHECRIVSDDEALSSSRLLLEAW